VSGTQRLAATLTALTYNDQNTTGGTIATAPTTGTSGSLTVNGVLNFTAVSAASLVSAGIPTLSGSPIFTSPVQFTSTVQVGQGFGIGSPYLILNSPSPTGVANINLGYLNLYTYGSAYPGNTLGQSNANLNVVSASGSLAIQATTSIFLGITASQITITSSAITLATATSFANLTAATSGANQSATSLLRVAGQYWTGTASAPDYWSISNTLGTGSNPTSTLAIGGHTGSSGALSVQIGPALVVAGNTTSTTTAIGLNIFAGASAAVTSFTALNVFPYVYGTTAQVTCVNVNINQQSLTCPLLYQIYVGTPNTAPTIGYALYIASQGAGTGSPPLATYGVYQAGTTDKNVFAGPTTFSAAVSGTFGGRSSWAPTYSLGGSMTLTSVTTSIATYIQVGPLVWFTVVFSGTIGGTVNNSGIGISLPISGASLGQNVNVACTINGAGYTSWTPAYAIIEAGSPGILGIVAPNGAVFTAGSLQVQISGVYATV